MPTRARAARNRRLRATLVVLLVGVALVAGLVVLFNRGVGPLASASGCRARVGGVRVDLDPEQAQNATTIAAVAVRRGLPGRAASIALATAFQESKLRNLDHGDRDSLGLFQQRPSQGWGSARQIQDPIYATNRFYDALVRVDGYQTMRITEAAQKVQRSGFPEAYQAHAADGRALASALTGYSAADFSCVVRRTGSVGPVQKSGSDGLTPRAERVRRELESAFGDLSLGGFAPGGVTTGHIKGSAHYDGRAVDVFVRPVNARHRRTGWAIACWLVARAAPLGIDHVIFDKRIWSLARSSEGWRDYHPGDGPGSRVVLEHRDHVHVDVVAGG